MPQGAQEADGVEGMTHVVREQIGHGADWIKIYADYRWGPNGEARPTFSEAELRAAVETARSSGRPVVVPGPQSPFSGQAEGGSLRSAA